jgi:hypothetical protein
LPSIIDNEYNSIIKSIEYATSKGRTETYLKKTPRKEVKDRLEREGYWFFSLGGSFECPMTFYGVSWKIEKPKKKWYHRLFLKC